ncbi:hypothetical protein [Phaeobacter sp. C3_T13_0]|uniref:hypothetical protein n=1 Tax=Phaeobacter cretensis TaxID=3342641 RepID=UPI0039BC7800
MSLTCHVHTPSFLLASQTFIDSLTDEQRAVFSEVGRAITDQAYETYVDSQGDDYLAIVRGTASN